MNKTRIVLLACACALTLGLVGCGGGGTATNEPAATDGQAQTAEPVAAEPAAASPFVGQWELVEIEGENEASDSSIDDIKMLADMGMYCYVNINEDGTAEYVLFGEKLPATWAAKSDTALTLTLSAEEIADSTELEDAEFELTLEDNRLVQREDDGAMFFEQDAYEIDEDAAGLSGLLDSMGSEYEEVTEAINETIVDDATVTIEVLDKRVDDYGDPGYDLKITNNSDASIHVSGSWNSTWSVNGRMIDPYFGESIQPGKYVETFMYFSGDELDDHTLDALVDVEGEIVVSDDETYEEIATYDFKM